MRCSLNLTCRCERKQDTRSVVTYMLWEMRRRRIIANENRVSWTGPLCELYRNERPRGTKKVVMYELYTRHDGVGNCKKRDALDVYPVNIHAVIIHALK